MVNLIFFEHEHRYIFSADELADMLASAGFVDIVRTPAGEPRDPVYAGAEGHTNVVSRAYNMMEAFALEARKPEFPNAGKTTSRAGWKLEQA